MLEISWILFIVASVAVILTPGQDMVLVMSRSIAQGAYAGVVTAAGVSVGLVLHTILATLGVGAVVQASELLFTLMKILGAGYLIYLGVTLIASSSSATMLATASPRSDGRLFLDGTISNVSNPKIAIFYFAFLPQFVGAESENTVLAIFFLGICFALITFIIKGPVGYFSGLLSTWFRSNPLVLRNIYRLSGITLIVLGVKLVFEERV
ncbi:threonine transporter RhtB [Chromatiales bacterium (ex Bugula neritina AB1)]|nr:threonine transporter RhtB [Chromatiales bacterium (ex Bugula neritina AB1)]